MRIKNRRLRATGALLSLTSFLASFGPEARAQVVPVPGIAAPVSAAAGAATGALAAPPSSEALTVSGSLLQGAPSTVGTPGAFPSAASLSASASAAAPAAAPAATEAAAPADIEYSAARAPADLSRLPSLGNKTGAVAVVLEFGTRAKIAGNAGAAGQIDFDLRGKDASIEPIGPLPRAQPSPYGQSEASSRVQAVALDSWTGQRRLAQVARTPYFDESVFEHYAPQRHRTFCGVASSCIVINALRQPDDSDEDQTTQETFLQGTDHIKPAAVIMDPGSPNAGLTIDELSRMLGRPKIKAQAVYAEAPLDEGAARLRDAVKNALSRKREKKIIANYHGRTLGSKTGGHFSPIAAYDEQTDSVLILDTAAHKNPPFWIPIRDLYYAMQKTDDSDGRSRGHLIVEKTIGSPR